MKSQKLVDLEKHGIKLMKAIEEVSGKTLNEIDPEIGNNFWSNVLAEDTLRVENITAQLSQLLKDLTLKERSDDDIVFLLVDEVEAAILENSSLIDQLVERVLANSQVKSNQEIRRDHDGVSQADYMVRKMIGEYLSHGKAKR